jgi:hypothetical protein
MAIETKVPDINIAEWHWQSDWNGDEVGYDAIGVVGLYTHKETGVNAYIDVENERILEQWEDEDE